MILQKYKIVFGGTMGAGKTEAIKSLSEINVLYRKESGKEMLSNETNSPCLYLSSIFSSYLLLPSLQASVAPGANF